MFSIALHPLVVHLFVSLDCNATYDDVVGVKKEVVGRLLLTATDAYLYYIYSFVFHIPDHDYYWNKLFLSNVININT